jgi:hypothetical protein
MQSIDFNVNDCLNELVDILHPAEIRSLTQRLVYYKNNKICGHISPKIVFFKGGVRRVDYDYKETGQSRN